MKRNLIILTGLIVLGFMFIAPFNAIADTIDNDVKLLRVNQGEAFATVYVQEINTGDKWELRLEESNPNKNAIMAVLLTAFSLNENIRIRWEQGASYPILWRAAIKKD